MSLRPWFVLIVALSSAGCTRSKQQPVAVVSAEQETTPTTEAATQSPKATPEPAERVTPQNRAADLDQTSVSAQPAATPPAPGDAAAQARSSAFENPQSRASVEQLPQATIPAGTRIRVRLGVGLDSKNSRPGERFVTYLDDPIVSGDRVVVPKGTPFEGHVIGAKSSGRLKGRAYLSVRLDSFRLHGVTYSIVTAADVRSSRSHKKRNFALIGGGSGAGAAIGAVAGGGIGALIGAGAGGAAGTAGAFITGRKNVRLPVETPLVFSLRKAVKVQR